VTPSARLIHPDELDATSAPIAGAWVSAVELDGESVLYDETSGALHQLDVVATVVWNRLDGSATLDDLAVELSAMFAADASRVRGDLVAFARQLGHQHLLEGVAPPVSEAEPGATSPDDDDG
jgi:hypothetical protein